MEGFCLVSGFIPDPRRRCRDSATPHGSPLKRGAFAAALTLGADGSGVLLTHAADADVDGDLEGGEALAIEDCLAGPNNLVNGSCMSFDLDGDGDVDAADLQLIGPCVSGAGVPVELDCSN